MNEKITALVVDDEDLARESLVALIAEFIPNVEVIGTARDLPEAIRQINRLHPQVIFLDIELPGYSGLQILDFFNPEEINFEIIFTTAYSKYAISAFQLSAVDYLLKPIQVDQLESAVMKLDKKGNRFNIQKNMALKENLTSGSPGKIIVPHSEGYSFLSVPDILFVKASGAYSEFILVSGKKLLVGKNLKDFEPMLESRGFFRPHRSYLINLHHVKEFVRKEGGFVVMTNGEELTVSNNRREDLLTAIASLR
ncbi:MAG: response regulator transcription factor [Bacteroidetes bacterium]|nr:response regulator transcription factor [Bacteroidota bacterium]